MIIDLVFVIILILAVIKGYQRGLIVGVFSFIAFIIGLAAAVKLSAVVAAHIGDAVKISDAWLPVISFAIIFLIVVLLVRFGARFIQRTVEVAMLGWVNRLGGIILYVAVYITIFSVLIFYAQQTNLLNLQSIDKSVTYSFVQPWGPKAIDSLGAIIPLFKNLFVGLEQFFEGVCGKNF